MASPIGAARSRMFQVKDLDAFEKAFEDIDLEINVVDKDQRVVWLNGSIEGFWPTDRFDEEKGEYEDLNLLREIAPHLEPGQVAVLEESSSQGPVSTQAVLMATNADGDEFIESLDTLAGKAVLVLCGTHLNTLPYDTIKGHKPEELVQSLRPSIPDRPQPSQVS